MRSVAEPIWASPAYDDRDAVWRRVLAQPSYPIMAGSAGYGEMMAELPPWFRAHWALDGVAVDDVTDALLHHEPFVDAARRLFGAEEVRPATLLVNLMGPMASGVPHVDTPTFRGLKRSEAPVWLLVTMGASGLFDRWAVRVATALTWFYEREDGEFEYWPPGRSSSELVRGPFAGDAFVSDGDAMRHRVGAIGDADAFAASVRLTRDATIAWGPDGRWTIRTGDGSSAALGADEVRVSILWKALTFADAIDARRFDDHEDDLDADTIVSRFRADLAERGVELAEPRDLFTDPDWSRTLTRVYLQAQPA
jgi:hypothetical protein